MRKVMVRNTRLLIGHCSSKHLMENQIPTISLEQLTEIEIVWYRFGHCKDVLYAFIILNDF